jgi:hydroxyacylglutathione hydrolase
MPDNNTEIVAIAALKDNYIWCIRNSDFAAVVDPGDAKPVLDYLERESLNLVAILNTHHHADHVGGNTELHAKFPVPIFAPASETISSATNPVREPDIVAIAQLALSFNVLDIPGHTRGHIAYFCENALFCGDTLFSCGCGRLFEGTSAQMFKSLTKLVQLPDATQVYCGHEYTLANIRFAKIVDPDNQALRQYEDRAKNRVQLGYPTLPTSIKLEKETNPFLRCSTKPVSDAAERYAKQALRDPIAVFAALREWKNSF